MVLSKLPPLAYVFLVGGLIAFVAFVVLLVAAAVYMTRKARAAKQPPHSALSGTASAPGSSDPLIPGLGASPSPAYSSGPNHSPHHDRAEGRQD